MAGVNLNRVCLTGNLTRDPELRATNNGTSVCSLRIAVNTRRKDSSTGEWGEKANYFDVTVWGAQADNCNQYLSKGRPIAVDGRLEWREYTDGQGNKRPGERKCPSRSAGRRQDCHSDSDHSMSHGSKDQDGQQKGSWTKGRAETNLSDAIGSSGKDAGDRKQPTVNCTASEAMALARSICPSLSEWLSMVRSNNEKACAKIPGKMERFCAAA